MPPRGPINSTPPTATDASVVLYAASTAASGTSAAAASFNGQRTSILWSAPGATTDSAETTTKNWQFTVPGAGLPVTVAATVCNFDTYRVPRIAIVNPEARRCGMAYDGSD
ncbi:MAG: hypothetical protein R3C29_03560 [Dehalococcoidia bacterium]